MTIKFLATLLAGSVFLVGAAFSQTADDRK
jgi:hypothetical protein